MKIHLKFDHNSEDVLTALDCPMSPEDINDKLNEVLSIYSQDDSMDTASQLSELIHHNIDYSVILYFATLKIKDIVTQQTIQKLLGNDDL